MAISKEMRVGAFVLAGLIVCGIVIFMIGDEKRLFDAKLTFHTSFSDVQGLKAGAPVRLGGIDIGAVSRVAHSEDATDNRLYVDMNIVKRETLRIRQDTVAKVANKGLLGDKMIELSGGSPGFPPVPPEGFIKGEDPVNVILKEVAGGRGYVHKLLADPAEADRLSHLIATLDRTATEAEGTVTEAHRAVARVNQGPGLAHELLYGEKSSSAVANFGNAAGEIAVTLKGIREGNGLAHSIFYGGDDSSQEVAANLGAITGDLRHIVADLRAGKGTLGALLVDPSIYEDVKSVLGNVQRNDALRALVRYSIKQDEKRPEVRVSEKPAASSSAPR